MALEGTWSKKEIAIIESLSPAVLPAPPVNVSNRFADDPRAAQFGQMLFFEPRFSGRLNDGDNDGSVNALGVKGQTGRVSCAGCHSPQNQFQDFRSVGRQISLAAGWGKRRTPMLLDAAQADLWMWDGRHDTLFGQIFSVIESPVEMNSARLFVAQKIFEFYRRNYEEIFGPMPPMDDLSRFPKLEASIVGCKHREGILYKPCEGPQRGGPGDKAEYDGMTSKDQRAVTQVVANMGKAIEAYVRLLKCGPSRFDEWVRGNNAALSDMELKGLHLFIGKARCIECHSGPYFSNHHFYNVGLHETGVGPGNLFVNKGDAGALMGFRTGKTHPINSQSPYSDGDRKKYPRNISKQLLGAFKTPMLRCVEQRPSFFHSGQYVKLEEVIDFFGRGGDGSGYLGKSVIPKIKLNVQEKSELVQFLRALTGPGPSADLLKDTYIDQFKIE